MKKIITTALGLSSMIALAQGNPNDYTGRVGINTITPKATLEISKNPLETNEKRPQGVLFPSFSSAERAKFEQITVGTMIFNTDKQCLEIFAGNPAQWSCITTMATNTGGGTPGGSNPGSGTPTPPSPPPPTNTQGPITGNVVLAGRTHYIASIKDNEYIPFVKPTQPATWETGQTNGNDPMIDIQGTVTTQGVQIQIPITGTGTVGAYKQEVTVTAEKSKNNQAGTLILEWAQQTVSSSSQFITATLKAKDRNFEIKQLDLEKGLGNDYRGLVLANFTYKKDNTNTATETFTVRAISGIPDKKFGQLTPGTSKLEHDFIYLPIQGPDGKVWLNNNLGAEYANVTSPYFNPARQAGALDPANTTINAPVLTNPTADQIKKDWRAYGYLYEWKRDSDGHEVIKWTSSTQGTFANQNLHNYNYNGTNNPAPNRMGDPCPSGFHTPTETELRALHGAILGTTPPSGTNNSNSNKLWNEKTLKLPAAGYRSLSSATLYNQGSNAWYWSSTEYSSTSAWALHFHSSNSYLYSSYRTSGHSVRCIADN